MPKLPKLQSDGLSNCFGSLESFTPTPTFWTVFPVILQVIMIMWYYNISYAFKMETKTHQIHVGLSSHCGRTGCHHFLNPSYCWQESNLQKRIAVADIFYDEQQCIGTSGISLHKWWADLTVLVQWWLVERRSMPSSLSRHWESPSFPHNPGNIERSAWLGNQTSATSWTKQIKHRNSVSCFID